MAAAMAVVFILIKYFYTKHGGGTASRQDFSLP